MRVVAIGGSVTTGMGARNLTEAYPYRIVQWLRSLSTDERPAKVEASFCLNSLCCVFLRVCLKASGPTDAAKTEILSLYTITLALPVAQD